MTRKQTWFWIGIGVLALVSVIGISAYKTAQTVGRALEGGSHRSGGLTDKGEIAILELYGVIDEASSFDFLEDLRDVRENDSVKGVVVRISSPGGAVGPSQEIYDAVRDLHELDGKRVVCSFGDVAASGGFYAAMGCEQIVTNAGTLTGSVGVIMEFMNLKDLYAWAKVQPEVLKAGKYKDVGSEARGMTPDERALMQRMLDDVHKQFKEAVMAGRNLDQSTVDKYADGRVMSGQQALDIGFVDELGGEDQAVDLVAELAEVKGDYKTLRKERGKGSFEGWFGGKAQIPSPNAALQEAAKPLLQGLGLVLKPGIPYLLPSHLVAR